METTSNGLNFDPELLLSVLRKDVDLKSLLDEYSSDRFV